MNLVVQAHGANRGAHCALCRSQADPALMTQAISTQQIYRCHCGGPIKPDITFFGEGLRPTFMQYVHRKAVEKVDLLIVMGTSLAVGPFNKLPGLVRDEVPKVLINMVNTGDSGTVNF